MTGKTGQKLKCIHCSQQDSHVQRRNMPRVKMLWSTEKIWRWLNSQWNKKQLLQVLLSTLLQQVQSGIHAQTRGEKKWVAFAHKYTTSSVVLLTVQERKDKMCGFRAQILHGIGNIIGILDFIPLINFFKSKIPYKIFILELSSQFDFLE